MVTTIYASQAELGEFLLGTGKTIPAAQVDNFDRALAAASRMIDEYCGRRFYIDDTESARTFSPDKLWEIFLPDMAAAPTTVETDENNDGVYEYAWSLGNRTTLGFDVYPKNAQVDATGKKPYTRLLALADPWPRAYLGLRVTAKWGWPAVPDDIVQATLLQSSRFWKRKDAVLGIGGSAETGFFELRRRMDPDVRRMIDPYRSFAHGGSS